MPIGDIILHIQLLHFESCQRRASQLCGIEVEGQAQGVPLAGRKYRAALDGCIGLLVSILCHKVAVVLVVDKIDSNARQGIQIDDFRRVHHAIHRVVNLDAYAICEQRVVALIGAVEINSTLIKVPGILIY